MNLVMLPRMLTMTSREVKRRLRANRRQGRWPWTLMQIAERKGVHRSLMTKAMKNPRRYPSARKYIEAALLGFIDEPERKSA